MGKSQNKTRKPIITGIILPSKWDDDGKVTRISIHTNDENEYIVDFSGAGKELLNLIHKKVEVKGKLRERLNGNVVIQIHSYKKVVEEQSENNIIWA